MKLEISILGKVYKAGAGWRYCIELHSGTKHSKLESMRTYDTKEQAHAALSDRAQAGVREAQKLAESLGGTAEVSQSLAAH